MNEVFKALADPTRRKILDLLKNQDLSAGEIADHFQMTKPTISHHLNTLKKTGLIQDVKQGQFVIYSLNTTVFHDVMNWFMGVMQADYKDKGENEK
ncbi:autorepressor SdpR family transcription factor [Fictibacillus sp. WQ 8-8]|uniref:autorepressor SdpR family transcription factor n=1 Tax=unclassified Fictibacillus TaxID=2644029 RepID=UPI0006A77EA2|nr:MULTISPECIES: autorepressor SdpR family transcription factor [unclassified Fictibacillus]MCQ6267506.1 autorepressor SdpR family transcription factor [Fictibacillus sp. WQ 8-8]UZJ78405.1 autorepressor SdpR family transcription factor [Fictibacillus sp. KU28468]SFE51896.1 transcriptional regulator, ArsR family [Bacillus sp. OV194]